MQTARHLTRTMKNRTGKVSSRSEGAPPTAARVAPPDGWITTEDVAAAWGVSRATIDRERAAGNLHGKAHGSGYIFLRDEALTVGAARKTPTGIAAKEQADGERDARVFAAFQDGLSINAVVVRERVAVGIVMRLHEAWRQGREMEGRSVECLHRHSDVACEGVPELHNMLCDAHAARSRILNEEELLLLNNQTIPTALHCAACDGLAASGVCARCLTGLTVTLEGEAPGCRIVVRARNKILAIVDAIKTREMGQKIIGIARQVPMPDTAPGEGPVVVKSDRPLPEGEALADLIRDLNLKMTNLKSEK